MKAIGYLRVSDEKQVASGLGLEDQRRSIELAAQRLGAELVEVHVDGGLSGKLAVEARPGLLAAVADVGRWSHKAVSSVLKTAARVEATT